MKKTLFFLLFLPVLLFPEKIEIKGHLVPGVTVTADDTTWNFYQIKNKEKLTDTIEDNLKKYYKTAWETYFDKKGNLPQCFQDALDNLHQKVPEIKLSFFLDSAGGYFYEKGKYSTGPDGGPLIGAETKIVNGEMIDYACDIGVSGATIGNIIAIGNAFTSPSNSLKYSTRIGECDLTYSINFFLLKLRNSELLEENDQKCINYLVAEWEASGSISDSIPATIFHELVHMALKNSNTISSRWNDDATVEDVTLKIFSNSKATYQEAYDFFLWEYLEKKKNPVFKYNSDSGHERSYNPPVINGLVYDEIKDKVEVITQGKNRITGKTINLGSRDKSKDCQDAICKPMKDYIIPYLCKCDPEGCQKKPPDDKKRPGPGGDNADDRYSFSEGIVREYNLAPEAVIFTDGYWQDALKLYGGLKFNGDNAAEQLFKSTPFLIIPSGGLFSKENDTTLKLALEQYVARGGTIVVFCQQYGSHIENVVPIPEGESLKVYGWRQDQRILS